MHVQLCLHLTGVVLHDTEPASRGLGVLWIQGFEGLAFVLDPWCFKDPWGAKHKYDNQKDHDTQKDYNHLCQEQ